MAGVETTKLSLLFFCSEQDADLSSRLDEILETEPQKSIQEILVLDLNANTNHESIVKAKAHPKIRWVDASQLSFDSAKRFGVNEAKAEYVLIYDENTKWCDQWLEQHIENLRRVKSVGAIGGVGGPLAFSGQNQVSRALEQIRWSALGHGFSSQAWVTPGQREVDHLATTNVVFSRKAVLSAGELSSVGPGEEVLLGQSVRELGYKFFLFDKPAAELSDVTSLSEWSNRLFSYGQAQSEHWFSHRAPFWGGLGFCVFVLSWVVIPHLFWLYALALFIEGHRVNSWQPKGVDLIIKSFLVTHFSYAAGFIHGLCLRLRRLIRTRTSRSYPPRLNP